MKGKFNQLCVLQGCLMPKGGAKKLESFFSVILFGEVKLFLPIISKSISIGLVSVPDTTKASKSLLLQ